MIAGNAVIFGLLLFFFLWGRDFSLAQKEDARLIGASYMTMNNEFYTIISEEVAYRAEVEGDRMILRDLAFDPERQADQIRDLLDMGISALVVEIAMPRLREAIDERLDFDMVFCLNDLAGVGVVAVLDENGLLEKVDVYGVDASLDSKELIYEGKMEASAAQFPTVIGREAADAIYRCLNGEEMEDTILTPVKLINADNVEEFGINRWQ